MADTVDLQIHLNPSCASPDVLSAVMDLSASIGFETMGLNLPIVTEGIRMNSSFKHHLHIGLNHELKEKYQKNIINTYYLTGNNELSLANSIRDFALSLILKHGRLSKKIVTERFSRRKGFQLFNPFSNEGFYGISIKNLLTFFLPYKILLFSHLRQGTAVEAANFTARLGLESLHLSLPLTLSLSSKPDHKKPLIYIGKKEDLRQIGIKKFYGHFCSQWDSGIFLVPTERKIPDILICGEEAGLQKILRYLSALPTDLKGPEDPISKEIKRFAEGLTKFISKKPFRSSPFPKKIVRSYSLKDEKKEIIGILERGLKKIPPVAEPLEIEVRITQPERGRKRFAGELKKLLRNLGITPRKIQLTVLNAYKPGLSWMKEVVLKEVYVKKADRVEITFKPFREKGLEEPIRWLQEIYPIDEIFARKLGILKEKIQFKRDSRIKEVYRVRAWRRGKKIYRSGFSPKWGKMDYLISFPGMGKVHPCTGWISVKIDGKEVIGQEVRTGIEQIWEVYQKEVLPLIEKEADHVLLEKKTEPQYSIFEELRFDVYFNYPMEKLGVDEERISPLEALHEDLYFVTLDYFSNYLKRKGIIKNSPGRILPIIRPNYQRGKGRIKFTLTHRPEGISDKYGISLNGIAFRGSEILADLLIESGHRVNSGGLRDRIRSYQNRRNGGFRIEKVFKEKRPGKGLRIITAGSDLMGKKFPEHKGKPKPVDIPMERPIGYREGLNLVRSLEGVPGVHIVNEGTSSGGLSIYSIEHSYPCSASFVSHMKRAALRPTFFINCRHHANEISSTNAGLKLSYLLATQPDLRRLLKRVNVVINPMENVDGVDILEKMLRLAPGDKLHAGRYNRAGREYYGEYFNPETPFGEAKVKADIWRRWLPDICADDHGFPSHEWEQPFSGYSPFHFREWWIPRTFFFFYLPFLEERKRSLKRIRSEEFGRRIWSSILREKEIVKRNQTFSDRYWKYRGQWLSSRDRMDRPIESLPLQERFRRTNYSYRFPQITAIDFITEVADEITCGRFLRNCISSHLETNLAIINLLNSLHFPVNKRCHLAKGKIQCVWHRERSLDFRRL